MRLRSLGLCLVLALAAVGCGGGDGDGAEEQGATAPAKTTTTSAKKKKAAPTKTLVPERPPPLPSGASARAGEGRKLVIATGCLACHQIGGKGASEPGQNLDGIGSRRTDAELRQALVQPPPKMPAYDVLGDGKLAQLVAYLSALGGGEGCEGSDCG